MSNIHEFCDQEDLTCRIFVEDFVNSWYATGVEDSKRDAFGFTMFFMDAQDDKKELLYDSSHTEGKGVFARPTLLPLEISLESMSLMPLQPKTSQEVGF